MARTALVTLALLAPLAAWAADPPGKTDLEKMRGTWTLGKAEFGGKDTPPDKDARIVVAADGGYALRFNGQEMKGKLKLDPTANPKAIDMTAEVGGKAVTMQAIYEFDGRALRLCFNTQGKGRPTKFEAADGDGNVIQVWKPKAD